jgi:hypothetical protein
MNVMVVENMSRVILVMFLMKSLAIVLAIILAMALATILVMVPAMVLVMVRATTRNWMITQSGKAVVVRL